MTEDRMMCCWEKGDKDQAAEEPNSVAKNVPNNSGVQMCSSFCLCTDKALMAEPFSERLLTMLYCLNERNRL
jgi:hypothetical protein